VNLSSAVLDLGGVTIADAVDVRHRFASGSLGCGQAVVVFGGGNAMAGGWVAGAVTASSGALSLNNDGDTVRVGDAAGIDRLGTASYGAEGGDDQSLVRNPEAVATSPLVRHTEHPAAGGRRFSPGVRVDGSPF
jgi:hypothetical protein